MHKNGPKNSIDFSPLYLGLPVATCGLLYGWNRIEFGTSGLIGR